MSDLISLRFIKAMSPYKAGDVAGFNLNHAENIVKDGRAVYANPPIGCDEYGKPLIKSEVPVEKPKKRASKRKTAPKKEPEDGIESRKSGRLGTVKK